MAKFPFVVEPRAKAIMDKIGSEEAGYIEIKRQGYLTVAEKSAYQQITASQDTTNDVLTLTRKIASERRIDMEEAYKLSTNCLTGRVTTKEEQEVMDQYSEELAELTSKLLLVESNQRMVRSYIMAAFRLDAEITYEDMGELHPDIIDGLVELFDDEELKSTKRLEEAMLEGKDAEADKDSTEAISQLEEAEKKPRRKAKQASTSQKSSGN